MTASSPTGRPFRPSGRVRSRIYAMLWTCGDGLLRAGNALRYVAAGLLRHDDLRIASTLQWRHYCASPDEVDAGLTPFEQRIYTRWLRPSDRVLLIGAGAGRDLVGLRQLGYNVTGLEQSPDLVELCRDSLARHGMPPSIELGLIETVAVAPCDAVIWSNFSYGCVHPSAARVGALARIRAHLSPGGHIVLGYVTLHSQSRAAVWLTRVSASLASAGWRPEPGDTFTRDHLVSGLPRFAHMFRPGEVERECAQAGLRVIAEEACEERTRCAIAQIRTAQS